MMKFIKKKVLKIIFDFNRKTSKLCGRVNIVSCFDENRVGQLKIKEGKTTLAEKL